MVIGVTWRGDQKDDGTLITDDSCFSLPMPISSASAAHWSLVYDAVDHQPSRR